MFKTKDLLWLLAYPIYQILSTLRHEGAHALLALLGGAEVTAFTFWPSRLDGSFYWGYVIIHGETGWLFLAAPYLLDLITFAITFGLCMGVRFKSRWLWLNLVIVGMISPLVNTAYNYWGGFRSHNDVGELLELLSGKAIHGYFILTLLLYVIGIFLVFMVSKTSTYHKRRT